MRCYKTLLFFIALLALLPAVGGHAAQFDTVLTGTGDPATDIQAVQAAIDKGGTIRLKGVFDFGTDGSVTITRDVRIQGEQGANGTPATRIRGGRWTLRTSLPETLPPEKPGPQVTIRNIHFSGALWTPISLPYCGGADIGSNRISDVVPMDTKEPFFGKEGIHRQQGVVFYPPYTLPEKFGKYLPGLITGNIVIADNHIDLEGPIPEKTVGQGILVVGATGANLQILRNQLLNVSRNSIECLDNYPGPDGEGATIIRGNRITTAEKGLALPSPSTPNGIVAGWFLDPSGASDPARRSRIVVAGNRIEVRGETSFGILVLNDGAVIAGNHLVVSGEKRARGILHFNSRATIVHNSFEGAGLAGIMLTPWKAFTGSRNILIGNDFSRFNASAANILVKGQDNIIMGETGKVVSTGGPNLVLE